MPQFTHHLSKKDEKFCWREGQNPPKFIPRRTFQQAEKQLKEAA